MIEINKMKFEECHLVVKLIHELAKEQNLSSMVKVTPERLQEDGFGSHPKFEAWLARIDDAVLGFSLITHLYSGWLGEQLLYIEDLYILPEYRNRGYGRFFLHFLAQQAYNQNIQLVWETERNNFARRQFYYHMGAKDRTDKVGFYMGGDSLDRFVKIPILQG